MTTRVPVPVLLGLCAAACLDPATLAIRRAPFHALATSSATYTAFPARSGQPDDFKDGRNDVSPVPSWLYPGQWSLIPSATGFTGGVYHQDETGPYPHVSVRRYAGTVFGPDGQLPSHYRISGAIQPFEQGDHMPPIGENGFLVYYLSPKTYVELCVASGNVSVWSCDHAGPDGSNGWTGHQWFGIKTNPGEIRRLSAEIDTTTHELTYWVEGQPAGHVTVPLLANTAGHTFALRSIGNKLNFGELQVVNLTQGPEGAPPPTSTPTATPTSAPPTPQPAQPPAPGGTITITPDGQLPQGLVWHGAAASDHAVFVTGGSNGSSSFDGVWSSPTGGPWSWQHRTTLPKATEGHVSAVIGRYLYVLGGWGRNVDAPRADVYKAEIQADGSLGPWQSTTALPSGRSYSALTVDGNRLILIGGWGPSWSPQSSVWTATADGQGNLSAWQSGPDLPAPRAWAGAALANGKLWITGGSAGKMTQAGTYVASYSNGQIGAWQEGPALPRPIEAQACVVLNGVLTTIGGDDYSRGTPSPTDAAFQLINGSWQVAGHLPFAGFAQVPAQSANGLYLIGGHNADHAVLSGIWQVHW